MSTCATNQETTRRAAIRGHRSPGPATGLRQLLTALVLALAAVLISSPTVHAGQPENPCPAQTFCAWSGAGHVGRSHHAEVPGTVLERCVALPKELEAQSFVNNTGRPVTVYQDPTCATEAEFATFPTGSHVPEASYVARAIQIWTH